MSQPNNNKPDITPHGKPHSKLQQRKNTNRAFIIFMSAMMCLFTLLLIPTCTQASPIIATNVGVNHG